MIHILNKKHIVNRLVSFVFLLLALTVLGGQPVSAQDVLQLKSHRPVVALKKHFPYFKDKTNAVSFHQARAHFNRNSEYTAPTVEMLDFGTAQNLYWFKLSLDNQSDTTNWYLKLSENLSNQYPLIKQMRIYNDDGTGDAVYAFGANDNIAPGTQILSTPNMPLSVDVGAQKSVLIMLETMKNLPFTATPSLVEAKTFHQEQAQSQLLYSILLSAGLIIFSVTLTLYFISQLGALLFFSLYTLLSVGAFLLFDGQFSSFTAYFPTSFINMALIPLPGFIAALGLLVARDVLDLENSNKNLDYLVIALSITAALYGFVISFVPGLPPIMLESNLLLPAYIACFIGALSVFKSMRQQNLLFFALGWAILGVSGLTPVLSSQQGMIVHILILTLYMLAYIKLKSIQLLKKNADLGQEFDSKVHTLKVNMESEKQALQRKRESEKNMLQDLRQRDAVRAHELKVAKAEADEANKAKSDFLAMISHEIRTPMTGIMGMVQLTLESELDQQQKEYIETIKYSGETLLALLNDILDFSKIESGHMELENVHFELRRLISSVNMLMSGRANEQGLALKTEIGDDVPDLLQGDPNRIRQILLNLLSNAIKFTKSGSVTIRVQNQGSQDGKANLLFSIVDTGIGISDSAKEKLFGAYQQADSSISRRYGGTGLGLNICKMLTEAMGGQIKVSSVQGQGSTFAFNIPLQIGEEKNSTDTGSNADNGQNQASVKPLQILSVDDNDINLKVMSGLLGKDGHHVTSAKSGEKALELLNTTQFDIVLADMRMAQMDGTELTRQIRASSNDAIKNIPVIAVTGNTQQKDIDECRAAGMNGFLSKPPSMEAIRTAIEKALHEDAPQAVPEPIQEKKAPEPVPPPAPAPTPEPEVETKVEEAEEAMDIVLTDADPEEEEPVVENPIANEEPIVEKTMEENVIEEVIAEKVEQDIPAPEPEQAPKPEPTPEPEPEVIIEDVTPEPTPVAEEIIEEETPTSIPAPEPKAEIKIEDADPETPVEIEPEIEVEPTPEPVAEKSKPKPLSATADMAETIMHEMSKKTEDVSPVIQEEETEENKGDSEGDAVESLPEPTSDLSSTDTTTSEEDAPMTDKKADAKHKIDDLKTEAFSFYKKAKASIMLGLGSPKVDESTLEEIIIEEDNNAKEDIAENDVTDEFAMGTEFSDEFADEFSDDLDAPEDAHDDDLAEEAGQSVDLLNAAMIQDLQSSLGKETLDELFGDLFVKADEILDILTESRQASDLDDVSERGHELKGMAANFGLDRLAALGGALEKAGMKMSKKRIDFLIPLYGPMLSDTKEALKKWQDENK